MPAESGEVFARAHALAVLRVRGAALSVALLPAAAAVVLHAAAATGHIGPGWDGTRWAVTAAALAVLAVAGAVAAVITRAEPGAAPTVPVPESAAPDLYRMVRDLADRLRVPAPAAIELTPDCDSWLEPGHDRPRARGRRGGSGRGPGRPGAVLVIGSPFLWWMRVAELKALLAPVVAGTGPAADPEIAAARRFVRGLDAAAGVAACGRATVLRPVYAVLGWSVRLMLRGCRLHAGQMERGVAAAASERAQTVDYGLRIVAQEQVGLAYAGWDRLLTRVALPAWRMGRWPDRLDAGVVAALTELSRRDRLAEGFETRLSERPACDLLEEPGSMDEAVSLLAARLFHGGPEHLGPDLPADGRPGGARPGKSGEPGARQPGGGAPGASAAAGPGGGRAAGPDWAPVSWARYPQEVVVRLWREQAARLVRLLGDPVVSAPAHSAAARRGSGVLVGEPGGGVTLNRLMSRLADGGGDPIAERLAADAFAAADAPVAGGGPAYELLPPRTGRELLADHVVALVCCAALDRGGARAAAGLDWLDGPVLSAAGARRTDVLKPVLCLLEAGDPGPLQALLSTLGVPPEAPLP